MLISCKYCANIHSRSFSCPSKPKRYGKKKENNSIVKFRNTSTWRKKRLEIKKRDKLLCQYCLLELKRFTFELLDVHHIIPISKDWSKRLDNYNLITLCRVCHTSADMQEIEAYKLSMIARNNEAVLQRSSNTH